MVTRLCPRCKLRPRHETPSQTLSYCKPCYLDWQTERRNARRPEVRAYAKQYWADRNLSAEIWSTAKEDPVLYAKLRARWLVNQAVKAGNLIKPKHCQACGGFGSVEGHHSKYDEPLNVTWLCKACHTKEHTNG